ncbi:molybdopterin-guanine dinucleotide biosynthesis protein MobB [Helicobacter pylori]|uniref:molybdopterin-guanine dinucleotide biosynthesis protein MobB n=1 Tax=Helicobacter pylori TaxID=210 RepID=UPI00123A4FF6|nr:molybdopterin-guanine dinucleotide biosynthesis protein MobB [Helicobacter pylori]KAA6484817.1 molybdopterin-guanine dinucleotide biosynthesis protein MobB [Helicobacter pylori]
MKHSELLQTLETNLVKLDSEKAKENAQILTQLTTTMQNFCESLKTSYTDTLNTNSNTMKNYINLLQKTQESLKNSYLELEITNKKYKETIQEDLQEIKRQIRKNLTENLAKKSLIPILTFIGGVVIMGALIFLYHNITTPPTKDQLEHSFKMRKLKQKIEELEQENKVFKEFYLQHRNEN